MRTIKKQNTSYGQTGRKSTLLLCALLVCTLTGCGAATVEDQARISIPLYEIIEYGAVTVERGDLKPELKFSIMVDDYERINYRAYQDGLELQAIHVSVGDAVKKGDVLVSFQSGDLEETIRSYQKQLSDDELLLEHYERLKKLMDDYGELPEAETEDKEETDADEEMLKAEQSDYSVSIRDLKKEMELLKVQIAEAEEKLASYSLVAERDGTITYIEDSLYYGYVVIGSDLVTETCGSDFYQTTVSNDYDFKIGDIYTAVSGVAKYDMELISIEDAENKGDRVLKFRPVSDMSGVSEADSFNVTIPLEVIKDACYVPSRYIFTEDDKYYVYVLDENGFCDGVEVTLGATVGEGSDQVTVITSGLTGGEQVVKR